MPSDLKKDPGKRKRKHLENSTTSNYRDLPLGRIRGNKWNPRSTGFDGPAFEELVASIMQKGIIQPIVVRSILEEEFDFEILAGERRHRAMCLIASQDPTRCTIPAILRECDDDEAFEICFIENLQRQDFTEPEEARAFADYVERRGTDSVIILAEKLGVSPRYVRKRVEIMRLPKPLIWAWQKEILQYGHLEQFLRIAEKKERLTMLKQIIEAWVAGEGIPTVRDFRQSLDEASADLSHALFDKGSCIACAKNSETQRNLFGIGDDHARCLDSRCYVAKRKEWLSANWQSHIRGLDPELNTNGIRFSDEISHTNYEPFYGRHPSERCLGCESFVTVLHTSGSIHRDRVCFGRAECRNQELNNRNKNSSSMQPTTSAEGTAPGRDGKEDETPAKPWHGEYFREEFFKARIPEKAKELDPFDEKMVRLSLLAVVAGNTHIHPWFSVRLDLPKKPKETDYSFFLPCRDIFSAVESVGSDQVRALLQEATIEVLLNGRTVMAATRYRAAKFLGIDLATEWRITKDYLEKKTKSEIVSIINRFEILDQSEAWKFAGESCSLKLKSAISRLKKEQMMGIILDSGIDLAGIVPAEILYDSTKTAKELLRDEPLDSSEELPAEQMSAQAGPQPASDEEESHDGDPGYTVDPEEETMSAVLM